MKHKIIKNMNQEAITKLSKIEELKADLTTPFLKEGEVTHET